MNENDVLTTVRESFDGVRMTTALESIEARGRARRRRRRLPACAGGAVAAAAACAAVVATVLAAPASPAPAVSLAAWSVARGPGGRVVVTIRELHDTAGLQRRLRADGVPAVVWGGTGEPRSCRLHGVNDLRLLLRIVDPDPTKAVDEIAIQDGGRALVVGQIEDPAGTQGSAVITIRPAAIPGGVRLSMGVGVVPVVMPHSAAPVGATGVTARPPEGRPATHQTGVALQLGLCR